MGPALASNGSAAHLATSCEPNPCHELEGGQPSKETGTENPENRNVRDPKDNLSSWDSKAAIGLGYCEY